MHFAKNLEFWRTKLPADEAMKQTRYERDMQIVRMRNGGMTFQQIADAHDLTPARARMIFELNSGSDKYRLIPPVVRYFRQIDDLEKLFKKACR